MTQLTLAYGRGHHPNSQSAHADGVQGAFGRRAQLVLQAVREAGVPLTDRQVAGLLGFSDMNAVRPRITELIQRGYLAEVGRTLDAVTGKPVRLVEEAGVE